MSFPLPPEFERAVLDRVRSGQYASPEDVLAAMVEALDDAEAEYDAKLEELRRDVQLGFDQLDRGQRLSREEALARLREARPGARISGLQRPDEEHETPQIAESDETAEWLARVGQIPAQLRAFVDEEVRLGRYESANKVIEIALAVLHDSQLIEDAAREELLREIDLGFESGDHEELIPAEEVEARVRVRGCPADIQEFVQKKIDAGEYRSAAEAVEAGLRLLKEEDDALRHELRRGREQLERGQTMPVDVAFSRLRERRRTA